MKRNLLSIAVGSVILLAACAQPAPAVPDTSAADEAAIRAQTDQFLTAWNAADPSGFSTMYTDDAVQLQPDGAAITGREAILQGFVDYFAEFDAQQTAVVEEVAVFGDVGYARGTWSLTQTPKAGGEARARNGKWSTVHRRGSDGTWRVWRWMWNEEGSSQMVE